MLYINSNDIDQVVEINSLLESLKKAIIEFAKGESTIPKRMHLDFQENTLLLMPGISGGIMGTKLVSFFPGNLSKNKPAIQGVFVLNDHSSGEVIAIMDAAKLTEIRTAAVSLLGAQLLRQPKQKIGIVGSGVQARGHAHLFLKSDISESLMVYARNNQKAMELSEGLKMYSEKEIEVSDSIEELIDASDIVVTTTSSNAPLFGVSDIDAGQKLFVAVGSYKKDMQELPDELYQSCKKVFVDTENALLECGDIIGPIERGNLNRDKISLLKDLVSENKHINDLTIFKTVGMALFDLAVGQYIFNVALHKGFGTRLD